MPPFDEVVDEGVGQSHGRVGIREMLDEVPDEFGTVVFRHPFPVGLQEFLHSLLSEQVLALTGPLQVQRNGHALDAEGRLGVLLNLFDPFPNEGIEAHGTALPDGFVQAHRPTFFHGQIGQDQGLLEDLTPCRLDALADPSEPIRLPGPRDEGQHAVGDVGDADDLLPRVGAGAQEIRESGIQAPHAAEEPPVEEAEVKDRREDEVVGTQALDDGLHPLPDEVGQQVTPGQEVGRLAGRGDKRLDGSDRDQEQGRTGVAGREGADLAQVLKQTVVGRPGIGRKVQQYISGPIGQHLGPQAVDQVEPKLRGLGSLRGQELADESRRWAEAKAYVKPPRDIAQPRVPDGDMPGSVYLIQDGTLRKSGGLDQEAGHRRRHPVGPSDNPLFLGLG
jgi:hypothetical protein